ncbi:MAG TPA: helix-turn-helix domain-containing protein [Tardiphaga sp.]
MAKRTSLEAAACPIARSMSEIGDAWSMLIIRDAMMGARRFSEFQKKLGLAKNILATRLRALVANGILTMEAAADGSAYQDYVLTAKGRAVFPVMVALRQWGEDHAFAPGECDNRLVDRQTSQPVRALELRSADGRLLSAGDTEVKFTTSGA